MPRPWMTAGLVEWLSGSETGLGFSFQSDYCALRVCQALMKALAFSPTTAAERPGLYKAEPSPKPEAPASMKTATLLGRIPPTGSKATEAGITARHALTTCGPSCSAGNILSTSAPAASAAKASVTVATPGAQHRPACLAAAIT